MQLCLAMTAPQNGSVQYPAVNKTVGKTGNIDAATFAVLIHSHLHLFFPLHQDLSSFQRIHILLPLAEVYLSLTVFENKMLPMLFPVVLIVPQSKARLLLYSQSRSQLQIPALISMSRRFSHTDQSAAPEDKSPDG